MFKFQRGGPLEGTSNNMLVICVRAAGGGNGANCTIVSGTGKGVSSIATRSATGKYRVNFSHVPAGTWLGMQATVGSDADTAADVKVANEIWGSYDAANQRVDFIVCDTATPTAADLATTEGITIWLCWAESTKPSG